MQQPQHRVLSPSVVRDSVAGEEDPGAALDVVRAAVQRQAHRQRDAAPAPDVKIQLSCSDGRDQLHVGVTWPHHRVHDAAHLLGMVMAHHGAIADEAWSHFGRTGRTCIELEVDETADGVFCIGRKGH